MKRGNIQKLTLSAMFLAIGLILPFVTGQIKQLGNMLLPMHLPVMLCGLICGWQYGLGVGMLLPLMRSAIFTMPVMFPSAVAMAFELATYGFVIGFCYGSSRWKCIMALYRAMFAAMIAGRVVWGIMMTVLLGISNQAFSIQAFLAGALWNALPGIALQLFLVPAIMVALGRAKMVPFSTLARKKSLPIKELEKKIDSLLQEKDSVIVGIDGPSGAGKTTLAKELAKQYDCNVIHMDDFFLRPEQRTESRLAEVGGNVDYERFYEEVVLPLSKREMFTYQPYDCHTGKLKEAIVVSPQRLNVVEGAYSLHPHHREFIDCAVFLKVDKKTQQERIRRRNPDNYQMFFEHWIPMEQRYFTELKEQVSFDIVMKGK